MLQTRGRRASSCAPGPGQRGGAQGAAPHAPAVCPSPPSYDILSQPPQPISFQALATPHCHGMLFLCSYRWEAHARLPVADLLQTSSAC